MQTAFIPYGAYWSTPFVRWQGSLAHLNSVQFAATVAKQALAERSITVDTFDFCAYGLTVIQPNSFYGTPWFSAMLGAEDLPGPTVNQACATGPRLIATAMGEIALGAASVVCCANAANESLPLVSQQGAARRQWSFPYQELQRSCGTNDDSFVGLVRRTTLAWHW